ncbi:MAG TPA: acetyl-CoA carboxylase carboxyl transferase subunit beta, partial [Hyphomonadaceae bacterium]|nr:acetyl-CoA carboxylase carboxyl transferase subunit beta [Hyphomonadaceae bacterium]
MNWLTNLPPGLKSIFAKKDETEGDSLWVKCPKTGELVYRQELESAYWVTPSGAHMRIGPEQRFKYMFDGGLWTEIPMPPVMRDPLKFKDDKRYTDRL